MRSLWASNAWLWKEEREALKECWKARTRCLYEERRVGHHVMRSEWERVRPWEIALEEKERRRGWSKEDMGRG